jgi:putative Mn2+ efflux pump MntP
MDLLSVIIIGIGLAMDCFAVSISKGIHAKKFYFRYTLRMAFMFGLFQAIMPLIGYMLGISFVNYMKAIDHWLAFGLLSLIGIKMIIEGYKPFDPDKDKSTHPFQWSTIITLALATSIDAFATGLVFVPFPDIILKAVFAIGLVSFLFTIFGMYIGVHFGRRFHLHVELIGGIILILIGTKILIEHLF